ncbi:MAG: hypothetical protein GY730_03245 [bacterium]|nr:hypothetical protein [bacterium]
MSKQEKNKNNTKETFEPKKNKEEGERDLSPVEIKNRIKKLDLYMNKTGKKINHYETLLGREISVSEEKKNLLEKGMEILDLHKKDSYEV